MTEARPHVTVTDAPSRSAFVATLDDGTVAGGAYYDLIGTTVVFTHTEVDPSFEGQGIGSRLAAGALALVGESGRRVVPLCPFIRAYMAKHPEHDGLLKTFTDFGSRTGGPGAAGPDAAVTTSAADAPASDAPGV